jgi:cell division septum initiation protein DivIVA
MGTSDVGNTGGPDPRVTELLSQVQRERSAFLQEKQQWAQQIQEMRSEMSKILASGGNGGGGEPVRSQSSADSELRQELEDCMSRVKAVEKENTKLWKQLEEAKSEAEAAKKIASAAKKASATSSSPVESSSGLASEDLEDLEERIETLEEKHSKMILSMAKDSSTLEDTADNVKGLEKRITALEKATVAAAKRANSRARSTTRKTAENAAPTSPTPDPPKETPTSTPKPTVAPEPTPEPETSAENMTVSSTASDTLAPHTAQEVAHGQASDAKLVAYLEGKSAGMYPKFSMSVRDVDGLKLVFFYKKLYVPEKLREKTLKYYHDKYSSDGSWTRVLAKQVIWPSLDADVTTFKP